jgi:hypothetical protein
MLRGTIRDTGLSEAHPPERRRSNPDQSRVILRLIDAVH